MWAEGCLLGDRKEVGFAVTGKKREIFEFHSCNRRIMPKSAKFSRFRRESNRDLWEIPAKPIRRKIIAWFKPRTRESARERSGILDNSSVNRAWQQPTAWPRC